MGRENVGNVAMSKVELAYLIIKNDQFNIKARLVY